MDGFVRVAAGVTSPAEFFSEENVGLILARGRASSQLGRRTLGSMWEAAAGPSRRKWLVTWPIGGPNRSVVKPRCPAPGSMAPRRSLWSPGPSLSVVWRRNTAT